MDRSGLTLYTKDSIIATTSRGNQEKWYDKKSGLWYKLDVHGAEALAEAVASRILREHSNLGELGFSAAEYDVQIVQVHGKHIPASVSKNFRADNESIVTCYTLLKNGIGPDFAGKFNAKRNLSQRIAFLVDSVKDIANIPDFEKYLTVLFEIDTLILNQDRHLNNIAVLATPSGYKPCTIFDNGAGFMLDYGMFPYDVETKGWVTQAVSLPFKVSFPVLLRTVHNLYGQYLKVDFTKKDVQKIIQTYLPYYPEKLQPYLSERVETVLMRQKKKMGNQ